MYRLLIASLWLLVFSIFVPIWPLELVASFVPQLLLVSTLAFAFLVWRQPVRKPSIFWAVLPLGISVILPLGSWLDGAEVAPDGSEITFYTHNMLLDSDNAPQIATSAREHQADVVALQETTEEQAEVIRKELSFRDSYVSDCDCSVADDELALITRYPIVSAETIDVDIRGGRLIDVELNILGTPTRVIVVHFPVPIIPSTYATRERGMARLQEVLDASDQPAVVLGDFNTTEWSPSFREFEANNKRLINVSEVGSSAPSWCDAYTGLVCLRIDHIFVDSTFTIVDADVGEAAGSDHRAVTTKVRL